MFDTRIGLYIHVATTTRTAYSIDPMCNETIVSESGRFKVVIGPEFNSDGSCWGWTWSEYVWDDAEQVWELTASDGMAVEAHDNVVADLAGVLDHSATCNSETRDGDPSYAYCGLPSGHGDWQF